LINPESKYFILNAYSNMFEFCKKRIWYKYMDDKSIEKVHPLLLHVPN